MNVMEVLATGATHVLAAMAGGTLAAMGYAVVKVGADAERRGGTCEQVLTDCDDGLIAAHCSACGAEWGFTPKYCHSCGAKVTGTRDERKAVSR